MIGITRLERDASQVLRPIQGPAYGMVLQVPYGPIEPTYVDSKTLLLQYFSIPNENGVYKANPDYKDYYEAQILLSQTPIIACRPQGDSLYGGVLVEKNGTGFEVKGLSAGIASPANYTFPNVNTLFAIIGAEPSANNNSYSVEISASTSKVSNTFDIDLYYDDVFVANFNVSLRKTQVDGFGNSVYIENVIKNRQDIRVIVNNSADLTLLPSYTVSAVNFASGSTITSFSAPSTTTAAWDYFKQFNKYYTNVLVDCSCNDTIGKYVIDIAETNWYQHVFLGAPSIKQTNPNATESITTFMTTTRAYRDINGTELNVNSDHASLYCVWGSITDTDNDVTVWISPASTAAARRAYTNQYISFSQAACGLNRQRGISNDFIELEQDVQNYVDILEEEQINSLTYTPLGKCIWDERTLQSSSFSNTSFQSHRMFFNTLEENIEQLLLTYVFTDNNESTRNELVLILQDYTNPMVGVHANEILVKCDADNNPASIINQRKMVVQVGVIPYPKANRITFEFVHTRFGVSLSEVL